METRRAWLSRYQKRNKTLNSNKFASLSIKLQLIPPSEELEENELLENASIDIAENIRFIERKKYELIQLPEL